MRKPHAFHPGADQLESRMVLSQVGLPLRAQQAASFHPVLQLNNPFAGSLRSVAAGAGTASGSVSRSAAIRNTSFGQNALIAGRSSTNPTATTAFTSTGVTTVNTGTTPSLIFRNAVPGQITGLTFRNATPGVITGLTF